MRVSSQSGTLVIPVLPVLQVLRWVRPETWFIVHMHGFDDFPVRSLHLLRYIFPHPTCSIELHLQLVEMLQLQQAALTHSARGLQVQSD